MPTTYGLTLRSVLRAGIPFKRSLRLAFASDTLSLTTMEIVDNAFILLIPGAMAASLSDGLFWWSLLASLHASIEGRAGGFEPRDVSFSVVSPDYELRTRHFLAWKVDAGRLRLGSARGRFLVEE